MTTLTAPAIRVRGVTKAYKDLQVLRGVDFEVDRHFYVNVSAQYVFGFSGGSSGVGSFTAGPVYRF